MSFLGSENVSSEKKEIQLWIPFCDARCIFCYFPTEVCAKDRIETYLNALRKALTRYSETVYTRSCEFDEIYFGGGTPSVLTSEQIRDLLSHSLKHFNVKKEHIIKIAGYTYNFDDRKLKAVANYGIDQVDLGIQTFNDELRRRLHLRDDRRKVEHTIKTARSLGLYVSIDLMYNLPGQTSSVWRRDLEKALELDVESVDCYPLDVYPDTILAKQLYTSQLPPVGDILTELGMYQDAFNTLTTAGYKPTCHNRFSRIHEDFEKPCFEILGTGAGFFMGHLGRYSYTDVESIGEYVDSVTREKFPIAKLAIYSEEEEMRKTMMRLYIRLAVDKDKFRERFGKLPEDVFPEAINKLRGKGLIEVDDRKIILTRLGDVWRANIAWEFGPRKKKFNC